MAGILFCDEVEPDDLLTGLRPVPESSDRLVLACETWFDVLVEGGVCFISDGVLDFFFQKFKQLIFWKLRRYKEFGSGYLNC